MHQPILIIADEAAALVSANVLRRELDHAVEVAPNRRAGMAALRRGEYSLLLLEEGLATANEEAVELLYQKALATPVLEITSASRTPSASFARSVQPLLDGPTTRQGRARQPRSRCRTS